MSERGALIAILKRLLAGEVDMVQAQDEIYALKMTEFGNVFANLHHYLHDADIRDRDAHYREFQNAEMMKLITHLEAENIPAAEKVSFLHVSSGV